MDNDNPEVTASYVGKLKATLFPPVADTRFPCGLKHDYAQLTTRPSHKKSSHQHLEITLPPDDHAGLSSTVQDSQEKSVNAGNLQHLETRILNVVDNLPMMASQADFACGTQPISQSIYESIIRKGKSTRHEVQGDRTESQRTFEEGDSGHVDITSSFRTRDEPAEDIHDSEPVDFSPVQTQNQLTQYPESQRFKTFKTPRTAGKKRTYDGEVVDTPVQVRNPLILAGQPTPEGLLGLSQAFAATQAASSPFSNGLPTGPRSDRPSPNIELQARPASAMSSSPSLRPITDLKKAATEPASKYVSVRQSQAQREDQERTRGLYDLSSVDAFEDEFEEDSLISRQRRQLDRDERAKNELKLLSSNSLQMKNLPTSSPLRPPLRDFPAEKYAESLPAISPTLEVEFGVETTTMESEAETEQHEDADTDMRQSSQNEKEDEEEDKENNAVLVPKTGPRRKAGTVGTIAYIDASPSIRNQHHRPLLSSSLEIHSSEPFRIMDSQPSQGRRRFPSPTIRSEDTLPKTIEIETQSRHQHVTYDSNKAMNLDRDSSPGLQKPTSGTKLKWPEEDEEGEEAEAEEAVSARSGYIENDMPHSVTTTIGIHTVPETDSDVRHGIATEHSTSDKVESHVIGSTAITITEYDTAPTHAEISAAIRSSQASDPVRTTPPGRKRRRMFEINAEPSPQRSQPQLNFDPQDVLQLDKDQAAAGLLATSQCNSIMTPCKTNSSLDLSVAKERTKVETQRPTQGIDESVISSEERIDLSEGHVTGTNKLIEASQEVVRPGRKIQLQHNGMEHNTRGEELYDVSNRSKRSVYDLPASPEQRSTFQPKLRVASVQHKPVKSKKLSAKSLKESRMEKRLRPVIEINLETNISTEIPPNNQLPPDDVHIDMKTTEITVPHMVFAYYKGDPRGYYPARLLESVADKGYRIQWDGYDPVEVDLFAVKALDLRVGDVVKILAAGYKKIPYIIRGFKDKISDEVAVITDIRGHKTLTVAPKQRKGHSNESNSGLEQEIPVSSIYLDVNMWAQLKSRQQDFKPIIDPIAHSGITTPHIQISTPSTPSSRYRRQTTTIIPIDSSITGGCFANMAFAISYDDTAQKNELVGLVEAHGGTIIHESFHDLLDTGRIKVKTQYASLGFTALLTDRHSRKEKYMQALALGLPCLSGKWIEACARRNTLLDWRSYLLPAGESAELDNATLSRTLPPLDVNHVSLIQMLDLRPNLLGSSAVIVVVGRGKTEIKRAPYLFLLLASGASEIHKVPDLKSAKDFLKSAEGTNCQWIFVDDKDVSAMRSLLDDGISSSKQTKRGKTAENEINEAQEQYKVAGNELLVQSLILGRLYEA